MTERTILKYKRIVDEYFINDFHQINAYQKYFPKSSYKSADRSVRNIFDLPEIKKYILSKQKKALEYSELKHQDILKELEGFAMLDITQIVYVGETENIEISKDKKGVEKKTITKSYGVKIRDFNELTDIQKRSITSIKQVKDGIHITFYDKKDAFEMINKHKGFYEKDNKQKGIPERVTVDMSDYKNKT